MVDGNPFDASKQLETAAGRVTFFDLAAPARAGLGDPSRLPYSIKVLLESALRNLDGFVVTEDDVARLAGWRADEPSAGGDPLPAGPGGAAGLHRRAGGGRPGRAARRHAAPRRRSPADQPAGARATWSSTTRCRSTTSAVPTRCDSTPSLEFERNRERYEFLKWGQQAFDNFRWCRRPPASSTRSTSSTWPGWCCERGRRRPSPTRWSGTDSHTTMINGLGVVGWGVGGIEAEAVMLGQPIYMLAPRGGRLRASTGSCREGATATDLVLTVTQMLRQARRGRQVRRVLRPGPRRPAACPTGPPSPTWRPSTAPPWASSRSTTRPWATCA